MATDDPVFFFSDHMEGWSRKTEWIPHPHKLAGLGGYCILTAGLFRCQNTLISIAALIERKFTNSPVQEESIIRWTPL